MPQFLQKGAPVWPGDEWPETTENRYGEPEQLGQNIYDPGADFEADLDFSGAEEEWDDLDIAEPDDNQSVESVDQSCAWMNENHSGARIGSYDH